MKSRPWWIVERAAEIGDEDDARLERRDEQRLPALVVTRDLAPELATRVRSSSLVR